MRIDVIGNAVIFQFCDKVSSTRFINTTQSGVLISELDTNQSNLARWGRVVRVGPKVTEVKEDDFILVDPGRWTSGFMFGKHRLWKTDEDQIALVSDEPYPVY